MIVFEVGARSPSGIYAKYYEAHDRAGAEEYLDIMQTTVPNDFELVMLEKLYVIACTTPHVIKRKEAL